MRDPTHQLPAAMNAAETEALNNLLTAAAVNKRLLMRILAHLEQKDLDELHAEVAALDAAFRTTARPGLEKSLAEPEEPTERPLDAGELPVGREEERRGHALPNPEPHATDHQGAELGRDTIARGREKPRSSEPDRTHHQGPKSR